MQVRDLIHELSFFNPADEVRVCIRGDVLAMAEQSEKDGVLPGAPLDRVEPNNGERERVALIAIA